MTALKQTEWARIMAHAWRNAQFKAELERDPRKALEEHREELGLSKDFEFSMPDRPDYLTDEQLDRIAKGDTSSVLITRALFSC